MKILHTSDWHIGHSLYNYNRTEEQENILQQIAEIVHQEQPDVMVICGDIYHHSSPSSTAQRLFTDHLINIQKMAPDMKIVVTAGNHDSSAKIEIDRNLWKHLHIDVIGYIEKEKDEINYQKHIIPITDKQQHLIGYVVAVPHTYPQNYPLINECDNTQQRQAQFFQELLKQVKRQNKDGLPVVLTAHLTIENSDRKGHADNIGGIDYTAMDDFGDNYDYLALGHIHKAQNFHRGEQTARYCGTPLPISFDENYPHSVSIVTLEKGKTPQIVTKELVTPIPLYTIPAKPAPWKEAIEALQKLPDNERAYIRLNVLLKDSLPGNCNEQIAQIMTRKQSLFCYIHCNREEQKLQTLNETITLQEIKSMSPLDVALSYYQQKTGNEMDEELMKLMKEAIREVEQTDEP